MLSVILYGFFVQYCAESPGVRNHNWDDWLCRAVTPPPCGWAEMTEPHSFRRGGALAFTSTLSLSPAARPYHRPASCSFPLWFFPYFPPLSTNLTPRSIFFFGCGSHPGRHPDQEHKRDRGGAESLGLDRSAVIQRSATASTSLDSVPPDHFSFR